MADEPKRHRIEVACPECGHLQHEPALVISTQCRSCRANFQVVDGKGVVKTKSLVRFAKSGQVNPPAAPPPAVSKPVLRAAPDAPRSFLKRLLQPVKPPREVACFGCGHAFRANGEAHSSQCPKCGGYISLLDHDINESWNRRIETCGDVIIRKNGSLAGASVRCHNLTVIGTLSGSVVCSGTLDIRGSGKIVGTMQCRHLTVSKGAHVEFLHPITTESAVISGHVRGQILCSGAITLGKRAQLHGLVRTTSLIIKPGAKHTGTIEVINSPTSESI